MDVIRRRKSTILQPLHIHIHILTVPGVIFICHLNFCYDFLCSAKSLYRIKQKNKIK